MAGGRVVRSLYSRVSESALGRPVRTLRSHPRVRAFARQHVDVLLARGSTWANVDGALRLLAEDADQEIVFGPWRGDVLEELLYWAPFVRWARKHFSLDPARVTVVSRGGVGHWYEPCRYLDEGDVATRPTTGEATVRPEPVLALVEQYRSGEAPPRPLLKRSAHVRLDAARGVDGGHVVLGPVPDGLADVLSASRRVVTIDGSAPPGDQQAALTGASGLVTRWSGMALLGALSGVTTIALTSAGQPRREPDLDLAVRVAAELRLRLMILDESDVPRVADALWKPHG